MNQVFAKYPNFKLRGHIVKFLLILPLCIHVYSIFSESISFVRNLYEGKIIAQSENLFLIIVVSVYFSMLWKTQRANYILFLFGQLLIITAIYNALFFSKSLLFFLLFTGIILFFISSLKIFIFFFSDKGKHFIETILFRK